LNTGQAAAPHCMDYPEPANRTLPKAKNRRVFRRMIVLRLSRSEFRN
jgi:hypothetical protein